MEGVLVWGEWERRRKEEEWRSKKEYWFWDRKGEEYFGGGKIRERGHEGERWFSRFLVWMRSNHGAMGAARYREEKKRCECGGLDDRDHLILYCLKWEEIREEVWRGWRGKGIVGEGEVDMRKLLFGEDGVKRLKLFAERIGWKKWVWEKGRWKGEERREGREYLKKLKDIGGERRRQEERLLEKKSRWARESGRRRRLKLLHRGSSNANDPIGSNDVRDGV